MLLCKLQHLQWLWSITVRSTTVKQNLKAVACYSFNLPDPDCFLFMYVKCPENTVFTDVWYSYLHESLMFTFLFPINTVIPGNYSIRLLFF